MMKVKHILRTIIESIANFELFILYIAQIAVYDTFKNYINKSKQDKNILVLANGPSLKKSLFEIIEHKSYITSDIFTVNFMVNDDSFYILKPKYHVISDYTLFYGSTDNKQKVVDFFNHINQKVNWSLTVFITYSLWKKKKWMEKFNNPNLRLIPFHSIETPLSIKVSYILSKIGLLGANYGSVLHHGIYLSMQLGYKEIEIYGADHTFFDGLCVDEENKVCRKVSHFYDCTTEIKPVYHTYTGEKVPYRMSYFVNEYQRVFFGHDILRYIADKMGVEVYNKTPFSLIDSYKRTK